MVLQKYATPTPIFNIWQHIFKKYRFMGTRYNNEATYFMFKQYSQNTEHQ